MADDLEKTLATIAKFADERKQRLARVTVDGVSFELLPGEPEPDADPPTEEKPVGLLDSVPGFRDPRRKETS